MTKNMASGNTNRRGRLCTVYILIKIVCFERKKNLMLSVLKAADLT
jgi:hypothetical protein